MKKALEYIGITFLFVISFIYTNKIANIIKNEDPIMQTILQIKENTKIESVNAVINDDEIIPGKSGCEIDENKSYEDMKKINRYNFNMLKYKDLVPEITINNIYNKYISSGNNIKRNISIVVYINDNVEYIKNIDTKLNIFLDSSLLLNGKVDVGNNKRIYNGGNNKNYDDITIEWVNDVITTNYNEPRYCLNIDKDDDNLVVCARNRMHSISPKIILNKNNIYDSKSNITNGSIIYLDENNIDKLKNIIDYITKKGYDIVYLDELLTEKSC